LIASKLADRRLVGGAIVDRADLERTLATVHALLAAEGMAEAAELVRLHPARTEQIGYDNWNGGTEIWEVYFDVSPAAYARMGGRRKQLEEQVTTRLKSVLETETQKWYSAKIVPAKAYKKEWRTDETSLPRQTRLNILDGLRLEAAAWNGTLDDVEFLSRLYDLTSLPSSDSRFKDAAGDIWQHCINNDDWESDWVF
jgi:hypothetical protein